MARRSNAPARDESPPVRVRFCHRRDRGALRPVAPAGTLGHRRSDGAIASPRRRRRRNPNSESCPVSTRISSFRKSCPKPRRFGDISSHSISRRWSVWVGSDLGSRPPLRRPAGGARRHAKPVPRAPRRFAGQSAQFRRGGNRCKRRGCSARCGSRDCPPLTVANRPAYSPRWSLTGPIQAARMGILLAARKPTHRVRRLHYSAGTGSASLGALPNAMIFERPATAIAVSV
jgi:hypothetical protein